MSFIDVMKSKDVRVPLAIARIILGLMLLWAFFDKLLGLGKETPVGSGVFDGGSPTYYFLLSCDGWFSGLFNWMADFSSITDVVMMVGLLVLGIGLTLGLAVRLVTLLSALLFFIFYLASIPPLDNPLLDYHLVYIALIFAIWYASADKVLGFGQWWTELDIVKRFPILQ